MKFKTRLRIIDAEQFFKDKPLPFRDKGPFVSFDGERFYVVTAHAQRAYLEDGDWIVPEPTGPLVPSFAAYPVKPEIFERNYVKADD